MSTREHLRDLRPLAALPVETPLPSRRDVVLALAGLGLGLRKAGRAEPIAAKKRKKHKRARITRNFFGCVDVGARCEKSEQCCSNICTSKKGKKVCEGHGQSTCQAGANVCQTAAAPPCVTAAGDAGDCTTTTGNAGYCLLQGDCFTCKRDADCVPFYGEGAACGICAQCGTTGGTICMGIAPI